MLHYLLYGCILDDDRANVLVGSAGAFFADARTRRAGATSAACRCSREHVCSTGIFLHFLAIWAWIATDRL